MKQETFNIAGAEFTREELIKHVTKVHELLAELSTLCDWELPQRVPPLIDKAIELRRELVS